MCPCVCAQKLGVNISLLSSLLLRLVLSPNWTTWLDWPESTGNPPLSTWLQIHRHTPMTATSILPTKASSCPLTGLYSASVYWEKITFQGSSEPTWSCWTTTAIVAKVVKYFSCWSKTHRSKEEVRSNHREEVSKCVLVLRSSAWMRGRIWQQGEKREAGSFLCTCLYATIILHPPFY